MAKTFEVMYQAAGSATGKTVQMDVYKPDHTKDAGQSGAMTEVGTTGRYYKSYDADAPNWSVEISDNAGGKAVKHYDQSAYDSHGVAALVGDVQTAVTAIASAVLTLQTAVTGVATTEATISTDVASLATAVAALATQLTSVGNTVTSLESPAMVG